MAKVSVGRFCVDCGTACLSVGQTSTLPVYLTFALSARGMPYSLSTLACVWALLVGIPPSPPTGDTPWL